jgi:putative flavoprotein involved in K+ transport
VTVSRLRRHPESGLFEVSTTIGDCFADQVVVATGGYRLPNIPRLAERFPANVTQLHSTQYRNPDSLPAGDVLAVGSGQSGCQIAEDLHLAGRSVHLCVGGHDIDLRKFATEGMELYGRLKDVTGPLLRFADDLKQNLDQADAVSESIKTTIDKYIETNGIDAPIEERYRPVWEPQVPRLELDYVKANIRSIVWCMGFRSDYAWIEIPLFDGKGYPSHQRGVTSVPEVYFLGLPWLYTWGSGRFSGIARDAQFLADCIEVRHIAEPQKMARSLNELALGS